MNTIIEEDVEFVASAGSNSGEGKKLEIPPQENSAHVRFEGSSASKPRKIEFRYSPQKVKRMIKLTENILPPPIDLEAAAINIGGHIVIDKIANTVEKKMIAREAAKAATKAPEASKPLVAEGHIAPLHLTGPEPAILPPMPKAPLPLRPIGK